MSPGRQTVLFCVVAFLLMMSAPGSAQSPPVNGSSVNLSWQPSARADSYDLFFGPSNPPQLYAAGITTTNKTVTGLVAGTTYYWFVRAHASCDSTLTTDTSVQSFATTGGCGAAGAVTLTAPLDNDSGVSPTAMLNWIPAPGAASYDVYFGSGSSPSLYVSDLEQTSLVIPKLTPGAEYSWRIVAKAACDNSKSNSSEVRRFIVTTGCGAPGAPTIVTVPIAVSVGATYTIGWQEPDGIDAGGSYQVQRATDSGFVNMIDQQETTSTSASFTTTTQGTYFHRMQAVSGCDRNKRSNPSDVKSVSVTSPPAVVVFTKEPQAVITRLSDKLEDQKTNFALENLTNAPVQVLIAPQLLNSVPFFTIVDPFGGDSSFVSLDPHKAKSFDLHFSGPPNDVAGSYQGSIYVTSTGQPLAYTPQAYVSLTVGGEPSAPAPKFLVNGVESEFAYFPPFSGDDSARPPLQVDILNSGNAPMGLGAQIGPEAWLKLEKDWNSTAIPASSFRTLRLSTQRTRAVAGSALPRYTYLTVLNKAGQSARLLVEDSGGASATTGRDAPTSAGQLSQIVPWVRSAAGGVLAVLRLTNTSAVPVPADLIYTPEGADGFDSTRVKRATIVTPPNDVVTLSDPVGQLFSVTRDEGGTLEIRVPAEKQNLLVARVEMQNPATGSGTHGYGVPIFIRGEGSRLGSPARVSGITSTSDMKTTLLLAETSGRERTTVHAVLYDKTGAQLADQSVDIPRYGIKRYDDISQAFVAGAAVNAGRVDVAVTNGGGSVVALAITTDRATGSGAVIVSQPTTPEIHLSSLGRMTARSASTDTTKTIVIPGVTTDANTKTAVGVSSDTATTVNVQYRDSSTSKIYAATFNVASGQNIEYTSIVDDLLKAPKGTGAVTIVTNASANVYARVRGQGYLESLPVVSPFGEALTGGGSSKPLYVDGLEQSIDATRGRRTSLVLTEVAGQSIAVDVRLYEPGNRSLPIAEKQFTVAANGDLRLDDLFAALGLVSSPDDLEQRLKNRINVACVITPTSGSGVVAAEAVLTDNHTGERKTVQFLPAGAILATAVQRQAGSTLPPRRRAVPH